MAVIDWLLDSDPSIRWQVVRDLTHEQADVIAGPARSRIATEAWGARLLALQAPDGQWGGRPCIGPADEQPALGGRAWKRPSACPVDRPGADAPGNVRLPARSTGLPRESVANASQVITLDKTALTERVGKLSRAKVDLVPSGIDIVRGRGGA
jgi:mRNA-degrading endonuclease toxin of MazEF toxin-antitoxin module